MLIICIGPATEESRLSVKHGQALVRVGKFLPDGGNKRFFPWKKPSRQKVFLLAGKNTLYH